MGPLHRYVSLLTRAPLSAGPRTPPDLPWRLQLSDHPICAGLVGYWPLPMKWAPDLSVYGHTMTETSGTLFSSNELGPMLQGDASHSASTPVDSSFDTVPCTMMAWIKETTHNAVTSAAFIGRADPSTTPNGGFLYVTTGGAAGLVFQNTIAGRANPTGGTITTGKWHHVVGTFAAAAGTCRLYLDGVQVGTDTSPSGAGFPAAINPTIATAGAVAGFGTNAWNGDITNCAWWDRTLDAEEVMALYANPWLMAMPSGPLVPVAPLANPSIDVTKGFALGASFDREPYVEKGFGLGVATYLDEVYGVETQPLILGSAFTYEGELDKTVSQGLALGASIGTDPEARAGFALGASTSFLLQDLFGTVSTGFGLGTRFLSDSGRLATKRYRR